MTRTHALLADIHTALEEARSLGLSAADAAEKIFEHIVDKAMAHGWFPAEIEVNTGLQEVSVIFQLYGKTPKETVVTV